MIFKIFLAEHIKLLPGSLKKGENQVKFFKKFLVQHILGVITRRTCLSEHITFS